MIMVAAAEFNCVAANWNLKHYDADGGHEEI